MSKRSASDLSVEEQHTRSKQRRDENSEDAAAAMSSSQGGGGELFWPITRRNTNDDIFSYTDSATMDNELIPQQLVGSPTETSSTSFSSSTTQPLMASSSSMRVCGIDVWYVSQLRSEMMQLTQILSSLISSDSTSTSCFYTLCMRLIDIESVDSGKQKLDHREWLEAMLSAGGIHALIILANRTSSPASSSATASSSSLSSSSSSASSSPSVLTMDQMVESYSQIGHTLLERHFAHSIIAAISRRSLSGRLESTLEQVLIRDVAKIVFEYQSLTVEEEIALTNDGSGKDQFDIEFEEEEEITDQTPEDDAPDRDIATRTLPQLLSDFKSLSVSASTSASLQLEVTLASLTRSISRSIVHRDAALDAGIISSLPIHLSESFPKSLHVLNAFQATPPLLRSLLRLTISLTRLDSTVSDNSQLSRSVDLIDFITILPHLGRALQVTDNDSLRLVLKVLYQLTHSLGVGQMNFQLLVDCAPNLLTNLVQLTRMFSHEIRCASIRVLLNLCRASEMHRRALVKANLFPALMPLIAPQAQRSIRRDAILLIARLIRDSPAHIAQVEMMEHTLVTAASNDQEIDVQRVALLALFRALESGTEGQIQSFAAFGAITSLCGVLSANPYLTNDTMVLMSLLSLESILHVGAMCGESDLYRDYVEQIDEVDGAEEHIQSLTTHKNIKIQAAALRVLQLVEEYEDEVVNAKEEAEEEVKE